jgi:hypothetical protein
VRVLRVSKLAQANHVQHGIHSGVALALAAGGTGRSHVVAAIQVRQQGEVLEHQPMPRCSGAMANPLARQQTAVPAYLAAA